MKRWVYFVVLYNARQNAYARFLLTAADVEDAERRALLHLTYDWRAHHSEMVCSTTDDPFFREL